MDFSQAAGPVLTIAEGFPVIRGILGFVLVFFIPGFAWTLVFFHKVTVLERIALSIGLSIALVTLVMIFLNYIFGVRINAINAIVAIIVITVIQ